MANDRGAEASKTWNDWFKAISDAEKLKEPGLLEKIIDDLFRQVNLQVFKRDKSGKIVTDENGKPQVDWISIFTGLGKLIGRIIALSYAYSRKN